MITYYRLIVDGENYGYMPIKDVAETIAEHLKGGILEGESDEAS